MAEHLLDAAVSTLVVFSSIVLPTVSGCVVLSVLAGWQRRQLLRTFGWKSLLLTGWLGTPIHELSHAAAALVFGHRISEMRLFKPDPATGQLGYVKHTYNPRNPYATILGNAIIPVAPLFGGALVMLVLTMLLAQDFLPQTAAPTTSTPATQSRSIQPVNSGAVGENKVDYFRRFLRTALSISTWKRWQFYVYLYGVFCIAMHLSPSRQDFRNFSKPALILSLAILSVILLILLLGGIPDGLPPILWRPLAAINSLLAFAIVISLVGAAFLAATVFLVRLGRQ